MSAKAVQPIDPLAHPGAMACLCLSPEQQQTLRDAAVMPDAECDHLTLVYVAGQAAEIEASKNQLLAGLAQLAQCTPPLQGEIGGVARFAASESSEGRDVCVALYDCPALPALYSALCCCLEACGIVLSSDHGFTPHITLAYLDPGAAMPAEQLERMPLAFDALSLIWADERIDLPLGGGGEAPPYRALGTESMTQGAAMLAGQQEPANEEAHETPAEEAAEQICPECGAMMRDDRCPECGYTAAKVTSVICRSEVAVKSLPSPDPSNPYLIRKYLVVWGGKDLVGDTFEHDTDLGLGRSVKGMPVYYEHTQRGIKSQVGTIVGEEEDDGYGLSVPIELERSRSYVKDVLELDRQEALGSSSGAVGHTIIRRKGKLKRWIIGELSLTPTPMEPRTHPAFAGKSLAQEDTPMGDTQAQETAQPGADIAQLVENVNILNTAVQGAVGDIKSLGATVQGVRTDLDEIRTLPAVKSAKSRDPMEAAAELGGSIGGGLQRYADQYNPFSYHHMKALTSVSHPGSPTKQAEYPEGVFGGYVKALFMSHKANPGIQRDAIKALEEAYGASMDHPSAKALGTSAGVSGAWTLPEQFIPQLMAIAGQKDVLYGKTMVIPADGGEIVIPALDPSTAYSEGQSAYYAGVTVTWGSDDDSAITTEPKFAQVRLKTNAMKAFTRVKNSLMMRSALAIDAVVGNLLGSAIGRSRDYMILRGTGQGQPLGVMFAPAAIDQGGSAIDFATLTAMEDNVIPERDENYIWIVHSKKRSAIWSLQQTNNTLVTMLPDLRGKPQMVLLGRPVSYTDKTPFASGDVSNTVNLIDPSMIVVSEFQGIAMAVSDQARFEQDETVIRAILSMDAQPWLKNKIAVTSTPDYVSGFITI